MRDTKNKLLLNLLLMLLSTVFLDTTLALPAGLVSTKKSQLAPKIRLLIITRALYSTKPSARCMALAAQAGDDNTMSSLYPLSM